MNRAELNTRLRAALRPKVDQLVDDLVARLLEYTEAAWDVASKTAIAKLNELLEGKPDVEDTKPVRDRAKARAAVRQPRAGRGSGSARARADRSDRAPAVPAESVRAASSAPRPPAVKRARGPKTCSKCGAVGFTSQSCGKTHNVSTEPASPPPAQTPRTVPAPSPIEAPPPRSSIGSRESRPLLARDAKGPSSDDDEEGPAVELFVSESNGPTRRRHRSRRQRGFARAFTVPEKASDESAYQRLGMSPDELATNIELTEIDKQRPRTRAECRDAVRPCPWVGCKHHLYLDVDPETGSLKLNYPNIEPTDLAETCALDVAERGGITLENVAELMNLTRERIRQVETRGLHLMKAIAVERGIERDDAYFPQAKEH